MSVLFVDVGKRGERERACVGVFVCVCVCERERKKSHLLEACPWYMYIKRPAPLFRIGIVHKYLLTHT